MAIKYRLVKMKDMRKGAAEDAKLFYPQLVSNGRVSFDELCAEVAEQSSLTSGDIKNAMDRLAYCISSHLRQGQSVDCGDLGSFGVILKSEGTESESDYNALKHMREAKVRYYPGKMIRETKGNFSFELSRLQPGDNADAGTSESDRPGEL